ncbi:unnamed protein product [Ilex paraguariensis]
MHSQGGHDSSVEGGKVIICTEENLSAAVDESHEAKRHMEEGDNSNVASNITTEIGDNNNLSPIKDDHCVESFAPEPHMVSLNGQHVQDVLKGYSDTQSADNYNQLVYRYYELEEQRQKVLQQLSQFGNWDYQGSGSGVHWSNSSTFQEHQVSAAHASYPPLVCSCFSYGCQSLVAPCTSLPACTLCRPCVDKTCIAASAVDCNGTSFSLEGGDFVTTATRTAERALSSLKTKASGSSDVNKNEEKEEEGEANVGHLAQSTSTETDLATVLNAWYLAGFHTGKYLSEQPFATKRLG